MKLHAIGPARHPRYNVRLLIYEAGNSKALGLTRNVSITGIYLETNRRFSLGNEMELSFNWGDDTYSFRGRVARLDQDVCGIIFMNTDREFLHTVAEVMGLRGEPVL